MDIPNSLISSSIERGCILHSHGFTDIDHGKFFVVIGIKGNKVAGFFFINSSINHSLFNKPEQLALQYQLKKNDYSFLRYDSFLCASSLLTMSLDELTEDIQNSTAKIVDKLKESHINEILESVRKSRLYSKAEKRDFFY